ncbi:MAG: FAD-dependent monooxygenase [Cytophagaceae bacterium]
MKAIIIGAGIGGLTTAIALQKKGIEVEVYEAAPEIKEAGAGIWVATNAMTVMQRLGLDQEIKSAGKDLGRIAVCDTKDKIIQEIHLDKVKKKFIHGTTAIHRAKLQQILYQHTGKEKVFTGKRLKHYVEKPQGVEVYFEDGSSASGDLLLGADGIRSVVRKQLLGEIPLRYSGQTCWRGIVDFVLPERYRDACTEIWGNQKGLRAAFSQINEKEVYFYTTCFTPPGGQDEKGKLKEKLAYLFKDFQPEVVQVLKAAMEEKIIRSDLFDFVPVKTWTKGRIALLGDAAHATTPNMGQGGCQAIEDAYVIADCLSKESAIENALQKYQSIRIEKARMIVNTSFMFARLTNFESAPARAFRNAFLRMTPDFMSERQLDKVYGLNY